MKKIFQTLVVIAFLALPYLSQAQTESPGAKDDITAQNTNPSSGERGPGGGGPAPIGGGLFILLGLGAAYGSKKVYDLKK